MIACSTELITKCRTPSARAASMIAKPTSRSDGERVAARCSRSFSTPRIGALKNDRVGEVSDDDVRDACRTERVR